MNLPRRNSVFDNHHITQQYHFTQQYDKTGPFTNISVSLHLDYHKRKTRKYFVLEHLC